MSIDRVDSWQFGSTLNWSVGKNRTGLQPVTNTESLQRRIAFTLGDNADQLNQLVSLIQTVTAGATVNVDLMGLLANVVNDQGVSFSKIRFFRAVLLGVADVDSDGNAIGTACSSVVIGGHATNAWGFLVDDSDKVRLLNGDEFTLTRRGATGLPVSATAGDLLQIVNEDGAVDAKVLLVFAGGA